MRTVTFRSVLHSIARMMGMDPAKDLSEELANAYAMFMTLRAREAHEHDFWNDLMVVEQRAYRQSWEASTAYAIGDEVFNEEDELYYTAVAASTGEQPDLDTAGTYWEELTEDFNRYIPFAPPAGTTGLKTIAHVEYVCKRDPRLNDDPYTVPHWISQDGVQMYAGAPAWPFVRFRTPAPRFTATPWNNTTSYAVGDRAYYTTTGEVYECLVAHDNQAPTTDGTWVKVDFPAVYETFVVLAAYADALKDDGQLEKAEAVLGETDSPRHGTAFWELQRLHDVEMGQQGLTMRATVVGR
jgi:hypothetical protein